MWKSSREVVHHSYSVGWVLFVILSIVLRMRLSGSHQTPELINISNGMVQRNGSFSWSNIQQLLENKLCQRISSSVRTLYMCLFIYPCGLHVFPARLLIHDLSLGPRSNITHFIHPLWIMAHQEGYKCFTKNTTDWLLMLMPFARHCGMVYWWVTNTDTSNGRLAKMVN